MAIIQRDRKGVLDGEALTQSGEQRRYGQSVFGGPIAHALGLSEGGHHPRGTSIARLVVATAPTAVVRRVVAVIVHAINRVIDGRARPHVGVEGGEICAPSVADADASSSVMFVAIRAGVRAAVNHRVPNAVFGGVRHAVTFAKFSHALASEAPTGRLSSLSEIGAINYVVVPAVTPTAEAVASSSRAWDVFHGCQSALAFA